MKKIYFYLLTSLVMVSSCVKQMDEPDDLPIAGKWAQVDSDGSVSKYVSFEGGKYYEYKASSKHYYLNENIWHAGNNDYAKTQEAWYSARNGSLTYGGNAYDISVSDGVLKIGNAEYLPLKSLKSEYGFALTHNIPINANKVAEYSAAAQEVVWNYQIKDLPKGYKLTASATCSWIRSVQVTENQIKLTLDENPSMTTRSVEVILKHPAVLELRFTLKQNNAGPKLSSTSTSATYASEVFEVPYTIENPRDDVELIATSEVSWITDLSVKNDKLTFKVLENNSGSSRSSDIVLTYGSVTVNHKVTQSYSAPSLTLSSSSTSCGYAASSQSFTYTLSNPREGQSVKVSCSASWITNLVNSGTSVSFKVAENNSGASRTGNIVLTYGAITVNHKVTQSYSSAGIICDPSSTSCDYAASSKSFTYTLSNPREGQTVKVTCSESWITNLVHEGTKVSFKVAENNSGSSRTGNIVLTYGAITVNHKVTQSYSSAGIICDPSSTSCDYKPASKSFTYTLSNPREGQSVKASCSVSWITNLSQNGTTVSFKVAENNSGSSRTGNIVLTYGAVTVNHKVTQSYSASKITLSSSSTSCDYKLASKSFTYTVSNPREGQSVKASCSVSWITNLSQNGTTVSFKVAENNTGSTREGTIVLKYGSVSVNHKVTQTYNSSQLTLSSTSSSFTYASASQEFTYTLTNPCEGVDVDASCSVSWISNVVLNGTKVSFKVAENNSGSSRTGNIVLTYGDIAVNHKVTQSYSAPSITCNPASTSCDYASASKSFTYTLSNPREGESVKASCSVSWITNLSRKNGTTVSFKVTENNSGSSRTGNVVLTYGDVTVNHEVTQSYSAPAITCNLASTSCDYASASKSFTYTLSNPREGQSVKVSCAESWITDLVHEGTKVSFNITENNSGSSRTGNIVLTYGAVTVNHKVEQMIKIVDMSSSETSNCYIVSESGAYKFKTVKGNSTTSVGTVSSTVVLWETFGTSIAPKVGDLIKSVSYKDGYITFQTADTFKEGNAVIAAKNSSGKILWSWHIWLTDQPQGQVYYNNAGTMMDRNLGATSATPGDVGALGLLYQWGRKDPFLGSSSISSSILANSTITWPSAVSSNSSNGTIAYATANPTTFIKNNSSNHDWYYTGSSSTDNTRWTTSEKTKSIYDPCPAGWRVPDGGSNGVWSKAVGSSAYFDNYPCDSTNGGMNFSGKFGSSPTIWYSLSGFRGSGDGGLGNVGGSGSCWSASPSSYYAYYLDFDYDGSVFPSYDYVRATGLSVRCLQE